MSDGNIPIDISVVIPVGDRHDDVVTLYRDYQTGLDKLAARYEVIFVLDGSRPDAAAGLARLRSEGEDIEVVQLTKGFGESTALMAGFERTRAPIIMTLPSYYQIDSEEIPKLVDALATADVAVGRRWPRSGGRLEELRRNAFHRAVNWMTGLRLGDLGCGARVMKRRVIEEIFLYGDQHRFLAVLANRQGFRVLEIDVRQSPRDRFRGRYRLREYAHRALDILTVLFLVRFTRKPLRFFGMIGLSLFGLGILVLIALVAERLFFGYELADRPALLLTSLLVVLGLQLFALGLLGELIIFTHAQSIKDYQVESVIQFSDRVPALNGPDGAHDHIETG
jgi:glycosyltransferase involved in cell wall biosynthesis